MATDTLRHVLRENVLKLLDEDRPLKPNETGVQRLVRLGIPNGTAQRVLSAEASIGLDVIEQVAQVLGIAPWRLLRPQTESIRAEASSNLGLENIRLASQVQQLSRGPRNAVQVIVAALGSVTPRKKVSPPTNGDA